MHCSISCEKGTNIAISPRIETKPSSVCYFYNRLRRVRCDRVRPRFRHRLREREQAICPSFNLFFCPIEPRPSNFLRNFSFIEPTAKTPIIPTYYPANENERYRNAVVNETDCCAYFDVRKKGTGNCVFVVVGCLFCDIFSTNFYSRFRFGRAFQLDQARPRHTRARCGRLIFVCARSAPMGIGNCICEINNREQSQ